MNFDPWDRGEEQTGPSDVDQAYEEAAQRARRISIEADNLRIREEARRLVNKERQALRPPPLLVNLADFLAAQDDDPSYRIDQLWPTGGRILVPAQFKAGKTTLVGNLVRALADGTPFLDTFGVRKAEHIILIDDELDTRVLRRWLRDHDIEHQAAVSLIPLRGNVGSFDILDPDVLTTWTKLLTGADVIIIDCLRPILDALGLDENHDAGRFLVALDTLLADAGCSESAVIHHMGHSGERSRGDSRLNDWPDAIWKLVRDKDDENPDLDDVEGARYFSAYGRDVDYPQSQLEYDSETRRLTLGERAPNRKAATAKRNSKRAEDAVMKAIAEKPGITTRVLREACRQFGSTHHEDIDLAVDRLVETGRIWRQKQGAARLHWLSSDPPPDPLDEGVPNVPNRAQSGPGTLGPPQETDRPFRAVSGGHTQPRLDVPDEGTDLGTVETRICPDCGAEIPHHHTRCGPCVMAFIEKRRQSDG